MAADKHTAAGQALGYVYQVGWALLHLIDGDDDTGSLRIENIDDVSWHDAAGNPLRSLQVKHHQGTSGQLGDKSSDLWRTVQVWLDNPQLARGDGPELFLVTTQSVPPSGALSKVGRDGRDIGVALSRLNAAAKTSRSQSTAAAREAWLRQPVQVREAMLHRLTVIWEQAPVDTLAAEIAQHLGVALPIRGQGRFVELLLGWWWRVGVDILSGVRQGISRIELHIKLDDLRQQFTDRNLPVTVKTATLPVAVDPFLDRTFIKQLSWIDASDGFLLRAVRDYYRAYSQAQHWVEDDMVELSELQEYEDRVVDEWQFQFELMKHDLEEDSTDDALRAAGLRLFRDLMNQPAISIRPDFTEPYFARGTHHQLADASRVGWHPHFARRLAQLLQAALP